MFSGLVSNSNWRAALLLMDLRSFFFVYGLRDTRASISRITCCTTSECSISQYKSHRLNMAQAFRTLLMFSFCCDGLLTWSFKAARIAFNTRSRAGAPDVDFFLTELPKNFE